MGVDRWGRPDQDVTADRLDEQGVERSAGQARTGESWADPRSWLPPEDRLKYYRRHEPMSEQELARLEAERAEQDDDLDSYTSDRDEDFARVEEADQREDADRDEAVARDEGTTGAALPSGADRDQVRDRGDESVGEPDGAGGAEGGGGPPGAQASGSPDFDGERDEETAGEGETGEELTLAEGQEGDAEPSEASGHVVQSSDEQDDRLGEWSGVTVTVEDGKVRVHDPLRPDVWNPERGEVKDQSDRLGDRIVNEENDKESRLERLAREGVRATEQGAEEVKKATNTIDDIFSPAPTSIGTPRHDPVVSQVPLAHTDTNWGAVFVLGMAATAAGLRVMSQARERAQHTKERIDDDSN